MDKKMLATGSAVLAAVFYAVHIPLSKGLLQTIGPTTMAALLYLGAGAGIGLLSLVNAKDRRNAEPLGRKDLPYVIAMIVLDIAAPILLMWGIQQGSPANASLLGNFEIVATSLIALLVFRETVSRKLWIAIGLITIASILLSLEGADSFRFSYGSLLVMLATVCWGLENNCTRKISSKSTYQIVVLKGIFSGLGALGIARIQGEAWPKATYVLGVLALGFVAYGLSIFLYVRAQNILGAAKTSAYYAANPFIGALLAYGLFREPLTGTYLVALVIMAFGAALVASDTLVQRHTHEHLHTFVHTHGGSTHTHTIAHTHGHAHFLQEAQHGHRHTQRKLEERQSYGEHL